MYIHPSRFVRSADLRAQEEFVPQLHFEDMPIHDQIKTNLHAMGYSAPSPIQDIAILPALEGRDLVGIASTGTGKTAAFAIPVINRLLGNRTSRAIILAPTRELAEQIEQQFRLLAKGTRLELALLIGGSSMGVQLRRLQAKPRIVIGTPGRTKDHIGRGSLQLAGFDMVILDEVDRMLDMGFVHDITTILRECSPVRQSLYFSATLDTRVRGIIEKFSPEHLILTVPSPETSANVEQNVVRYTSENKIEKLHDILIENTGIKAIIFDDTQRLVDRLSGELLERGFSIDSIHGGKTQGQRRRALQRFKSNEVKILVATDVAARGIDVADVTHVINFSLPSTYEDYIHRIGRTGRAGKVGYSLTFVEK